MEIFNELLVRAREDYTAGNHEKAYDTLQAALKYLKGMMDAERLISQKSSQKT